MLAELQAAVLAVLHWPEAGSLDLVSGRLPPLQASSTPGVLYPRRDCSPYRLRQETLMQTAVW